MKPLGSKDFAESSMRKRRWDNNHDLWGNKNLIIHQEISLGLCQRLSTSDEKRLKKTYSESCQCYGESQIKKMQVVNPGSRNA